LVVLNQKKAHVSIKPQFNVSGVCQIDLSQSQSMCGMFRECQMGGNQHDIETRTSRLYRCRCCHWSCRTGDCGWPSGFGQYPLFDPGGAGGGWDGTARGTGEALTTAGLVGSASYENMSGGGGGKAIGYLIENADSQHGTLMVNSTPIVIVH
jgi:hypothetical protein